MDQKIHGPYLNIIGVPELIHTSKEEVSDEDVLKRLDELKKLGVDKKASIEITSQELKVNKNYIKDLVIKASEKLK